MILAIDFDDTLMDRQNVLPGYRMGQPTPGAIMSLRRLHAEGHTVVIFTARNVGHPSAKKAIADWLTHFGIPFHDITNVKRPEFDLIIDNRALHFDEWSKVMFKIHHMNAEEEQQFTHSEGV